jgi:hypothetical protein
MSTTNITPEHRDSFNALTSGDYSNFALFSCFVNGESASAIVVVTKDDSHEYHIHPVFVSVTPGMKLIDHEGVGPT